MTSNNKNVGEELDSVCNSQGAAEIDADYIQKTKIVDTARSMAPSDNQVMQIVSQGISIEEP